MQPVRTALASFGLSGRVFHAPFLTGNPQFEVVAVLERHSERAREFFPAATIHKTIDSLLSDGRVELVVVNTPDPLHREMCERALRAGMHVLVEKPMVETASEAVALFALAQKRERVLTVYQNRRYDGDFMALRDLLRSGGLGRLLEYEARIELWRPVDAHAWREREHTGGILTNLGAHLVDQAVCLFGRPQWVQASLRSVRPATRIVDSMLLELGYDEPVVRLLASYCVLEPGPRFSVSGTRGSWTKWGFDGQEVVLKAAAGVGGVTAGGREFAVLRDTTGSGEAPGNTGAPGPPGRREIQLEPGNYGLYYRQLYRAIREGADPPVTPHDALLTLRILEAAVTSNAEGVRIPLPADTPAR